VRWARRILVRFWRSGEERPYVGHTLNLSPGGMFVGTDRPVASGSRVRVEVMDPAQGFTIEGVVTHSHRVAPELRRVHESGMGVRFLSHEELVAPLLPKLTGETASRPAPVAAAPAEPEDGFAVRFATADAFVEAFKRDIQHGGMFVSTSRPAPLNQVVPLQLHLPADLGGSLVVSVRVVHRNDPAEAGAARRPDRPAGAPDRPAGMGVEFVDREATVRRLADLVRRVQA
jgi:Tfp pilus assembly protein PilZ